MGEEYVTGVAAFDLLRSLVVSRPFPVLAELNSAEVSFSINGALSFLPDEGFVISGEGATLKFNGDGCRVSGTIVKEGKRSVDSVTGVPFAIVMLPSQFTIVFIRR